MTYKTFTTAAFILSIALAGCRGGSGSAVVLSDISGTATKIPASQEARGIEDADIIAQEQSAPNDPNKTPETSGEVASSDPALTPTPPVELPSAMPVPSDPTNAGDRTKTGNEPTWTIGETATEFAAPLTSPPLEMTPAPFLQAEWHPSEKESPYTISGAKTEIAVAYHAD